MTLILNFSELLPGKKLIGKITSGTGDNVIINPTMIKPGVRSIGSGNEDEMIFYPGKTDVELYFSNNSDYDTTISTLSQYGADLELFADSESNLLAKASLYKRGIFGNAINRTLKLSFLDEYSTLNESGEAPTDWQTLRPLKSFIQDMFPDIEIETFLDYRFYFDLLNVPVALYNFDELGTYNFVLYSNFNTKGEILKAILNSFGCTAVISPNRKIQILPRFYSGESIEIIKKADIIGDNIDLNALRSFKGLRAYYGYLPTDINAGLSFAEYNLGTVDHTSPTSYDLIEPDEVATIHIPFSVGTVDINEAAHSKILWRVVSGSELRIYADRVSYKKTDGTYSAERSLAKWVHSHTWNALKQSRRKLDLTANGLNYYFSKFYQIEGGSKIYRPVKLGFDDYKNHTALSLAECIPVDTFYDSSLYYIGP